MSKTVKSYSKRLKITKNGKILARTKGQNHFNARERTRTSMAKRRMNSVTTMNNKAKGRFLVNLR